MHTTYQCKDPAKSTGKIAAHQEIICLAYLASDRLEPGNPNAGRRLRLHSHRRSVTMTDSGGLPGHLLHHLCVSSCKPLFVHVNLRGGAGSVREDHFASLLLSPGQPKLARLRPHWHSFRRMFTALSGRVGHFEHHLAAWLLLSPGVPKQGMCRPHSQVLLGGPAVCCAADRTAALMLSLVLYTLFSPAPGCPSLIPLIPLASVSCSSADGQGISNTPVGFHGRSCILR